MSHRFSAYSRANCKGQPILHASLTHHGWTAHTKEILAEGHMTEPEIDQLEIAEIAKYQALGISMNVCPGGERGPVMNGAANHKSKPILQLNLDGTLIREWENVSIAAREIGGTHMIIRQSIWNKRWYAYGSLWIWKVDYDMGERPVYVSLVWNQTPVIQLTSMGEFVAGYPSALQAAKALGYPRCTLTRPTRYGVPCRGGFLWQRVFPA